MSIPQLERFYAQLKQRQRQRSIILLVTCLLDNIFLSSATNPAGFSCHGHVFCNITLNEACIRLAFYEDPAFRIGTSNPTLRGGDDSTAALSGAIGSIRESSVARMPSLGLNPHPKLT